ncbi:MAG: PD40 domain-containing protein [Chloroflexota bacterium]|nr:PD40 domain-containing protein [Chloroflexota bacterium]
MPPPATVLKIAGHAVYLRGNDLYVGALDGGGEVALTRGSLGAGYAGSTVIGGTAWLYYTSMFARTGAGTLRPGGSFRVMRRALGGGQEQVLLEFAGSDKNVEFFGSNASVSPDGRFIAYSATDGLHRYDLNTRTDIVLLANKPCVTPDQPEGVPGCYGYYDPVWSPRGDWLVVRKIFYEGARAALVRPLAPGSPAITLDAGGLLAAWTPDGSRLCISQSGYAGGGARVLFPDTGAYRDLGPARESAAGCAWSGSGALVVRFIDGTPEGSRLTFWDAGLTSDRSIQIPDSALCTCVWLPGDRGVIVREVAGTGQRGPHLLTYALAIMVDGRLNSLAVNADTVLAVLP